MSKSFFQTVAAGVVSGLVVYWISSRVKAPSTAQERAQQGVWI